MRDMEDFVAGFLLVVLIIAWLIRIILFLAGVLAAGFLGYILIVHVLVPLLAWVVDEGAEEFGRLCDRLSEEAERAGRRMHARYRHVTWRWRVTRDYNRAVRQIEAVRREHVESLRLLAASLDRLELPEVDEAEAVRMGARRGEATR
jgi:hypothetical protein